MKFVVYYCLCFMSFSAHSNANGHVRNLLRRDRNGILGVPRYPEHLPPGEPVMPGHTLLQPNFGMLKSAVKYPLKDTGETAVYGNLQNLGIPYGRTPYQVMFTNFRRSNYIENILLRTLNDQRLKDFFLFGLIPSKSPVMVIEIRPQPPRNTLSDYFTFEKQSNLIRSSQTNNEARGKKRKRSSRRSKKYTLSRESNESSPSSDDERNPGNPFTLHKNRYKQNWPWNHFMDGDHLNISPHSPSFKNAGPSGADLLLGRKWWYFNQDDFKQMA